MKKSPHISSYYEGSPTEGKFASTTEGGGGGYFKLGLHILVTIAEFVFNDASKKILKLSTNLLQAFPVEDQYLWSFQRYRDQAICGRLKKHVRKHVPGILTTYMKTRLNKGDALFRLFPIPRLLYHPSFKFIPLIINHLNKFWFRTISSNL